MHNLLGTIGFEQVLLGREPASIDVARNSVAKLPMWVLQCTDCTQQLLKPWPLVSL